VCRRAVLLRAAALGVLNPFLYYLVLFAAYDRLPGQIAMALNYAWPVVLALLAVPLLGQPLTRPQLLAIGLSFVGAVVIVMGGRFGFDGGLDPMGVALALGSTLVWALFWLAECPRRPRGPRREAVLRVRRRAGARAVITAPWLGGDLPGRPASARGGLAGVGLYRPVRDGAHLPPLADRVTGG
jgi:hypothetical protein